MKMLPASQGYALCMEDTQNKEFKFKTSNFMNWNFIQQKRISGEYAIRNRTLSIVVWDLATLYINIKNNTIVVEVRIKYKL